MSSGYQETFLLSTLCSTTHQWPSSHLMPLFAGFQMSHKKPGEVAGGPLVGGGAKSDLAPEIKTSLDSVCMASFYWGSPPLVIIKFKK